jgi:hypothetical protein
MLKMVGWQQSFRACDSRIEMEFPCNHEGHLNMNFPSLWIFALEHAVPVLCVNGPKLLALSSFREDEDGQKDLAKYTT